MADDAPAASSSSSATTPTTASGSAPAPSYANNPTDPTTWSPAFASSMAQNAALYAAKEAAAVNAPKLAELAPCSGLLDASLATLFTACTTLSRASDDQQLAALLQSFATVGQQAVTRFGAVYTPLANQAAAAQAAPATAS